MKLTIAFITGRRDARLGWVQRSICNQLTSDDHLDLIVVDAFPGRHPSPAPSIRHDLSGFQNATFTAPMPTIWQGPSRRTREDWWAMSNARNTALVLCETEWIAFLDDRCVLGPSWLEAVRRAMGEKPGLLGEPYIVCGGYEKRRDMDAGAGLPPRPLEETVHFALDNRIEAAHGAPSVRCGGQWLYGCSFALPLAWALAVNGLEEGCDGLSAEDYIFGMNLANHGYPLCYDPAMWVIQDRTPGQENTFRREDKGVSPHDKSHAALARFGSRDHTEFTRDLMVERAFYRLHGYFRFVDRARIAFLDWYDGELIDADYPRDRAAPRSHLCGKCGHHHVNHGDFCYCGCRSL